MVPNDANLYHINYNVEKQVEIKSRKHIHANKCTKCNEETKEYEDTFTMILL